MTTIRAAVYARISKDREGRHLGVDRQERECRELAGRLGWTVVEVFPDNDMSQWAGKRRPEYERMLTAISAGRVDAVLAWHSDRLHRRPIEMERYIEVCGPRAVPTDFVKASRVDLTTAQGRKEARNRAVDARYEVEHSSERIQEEKAEAAKRGERLGGARAFGYRLVFDREEKPHRIVDEVLEPVEADAIRDGVRRLLAGESVYSITKAWQATVSPVRGGQWHQHNVARVLGSARNAGLVEHKGEIVAQAKWPAIVSEDDWRAVRALLKDPKRTTYSGVRSLKWVGSGLYRCGVCGLDVRSASLSTRDGAMRRLYRCRSTRHVSVTAGPVDDCVVDAVCTVLDTHGVGLLPKPDRERGAAERAEADRLTARLGELGDMLAEGELDRREYGRLKARVESKLQTARAQLSASRSDSALDGIADAPKPSEAFLAQPVARQRSIIDTLVAVTVLLARPGRPPKGVDFDYNRVRIVPQPAYADTFTV